MVEPQVLYKLYHYYELVYSALECSQQVIYIINKKYDKAVFHNSTKGRFQGQSMCIAG